MISETRSPVSANRRRRRSSGIKPSSDPAWAQYHQWAFALCADRLPVSRELTDLAIAVAPPHAIVKLRDALIQKSEEHVRLRDTLDEFADVDPSETERLRLLLGRVHHRHDDLEQVIVDSISDSIPTELPPTAHPRIVDELGDMLGLDPVSRRILIGLFCIEDVDPISSVLREMSHKSQLDLLAELVGTDLQTLVSATAVGSPLAQLGVIGQVRARDELKDVGLTARVLFVLRSETLDDLTAGMFDETPEPGFAVQDFSIGEVEIESCIAAIESGQSLLIAGGPGLGKSEFARSLIRFVGRTARTLGCDGVAGESHRLGPGADSDRFSAIRIAANLLSCTTDVLIIDEADAVLQSASGFLAMLGMGSYDKALLNDLLDSLPVPAVWITNGYQHIPTSALRRFGHVLDFPKPSLHTRMRMIVDRLSPLLDAHQVSIDDTRIRDIAARYDATPAALDRAARIVATRLHKRAFDVRELPEQFHAYLSSSASGALAHDVRRLPSVSPSFDPRFCSTSEPLERIERQALHRASQGSGLRLLFGGPPGGGKTQYALYLARQLGRDVSLKRPSDLLSMYVGGTEQRVAAAFREAAQTGAVLVIDEADALLYDRGVAHHSWEHTRIAEFLQQVQDFPGILIACTNRVDAVDSALRRRFHRHVTFGPIAGAVLAAALEHIFPQVPFVAHDLAALKQGPALMMSDLACAAEMIAIENESGNPARADAVVAEILSAARARDRERSIGF